MIQDLYTVHSLQEKSLFWYAMQYLSPSILIHRKQTLILDQSCYQVWMLIEKTTPYKSMFINQKVLFFVRMWQVYFTCRSHWFAVKTYLTRLKYKKKLWKVLKNFEIQGRVLHASHKTNGRNCDILNNKPEFLFYRPSIRQNRYHVTKTMSQNRLASASWMLF